MAAGDTVVLLLLRACAIDMGGIEKNKIKRDMTATKGEESLLFILFRPIHRIYLISFIISDESLFIERRWIGSR